MEKERTNESQSCIDICIFMHAYLFIYLFQIYSICVYTYAYVNMLAIRRHTAPPLVNLMFLGECAFLTVFQHSGEWGDFC